MKYDICVFGGCALDQMFYKDESGLIPENPSLIVPGGKGANQAVAAARAGAKVTIISRIGKDAIGQSILSNLIYNNVETRNVEVVDNLENDYSNIIIDEKSKDNDITRFAGAINSFTPDMIDKYKDILLSSKMIVCQLKVPKEVTVKLINFCYDNDIPLILTPCRPQKLFVGDKGNLDLIDRITYITANKEECKTIFNTDDIESCVSKYPNKLIVTLGSEGVMYSDGREIIKIPAIDIDKIEDTTGAGDTFNGNLATNLINGMSLQEAIIRAQYASSMKIQVKTAQEGMPYKEELDKYIMNRLLDDNDHMTEFDIAFTAIKKAYEAIGKKNIINIKRKEDSTFVTESDYLVEKMIIDDILKSYPNDNFVTEEFNNKNTIKERTWVIDPIDGTHHYIRNSIFWGIQLAFIDKGETEFSIVYIPKLDEMYYAIKGQGTYLNHKKIENNSDLTINESIIEFCGSIHKKYETKKELLEKLINDKEIHPNYLHINSCCFAFANLVSGRTNILVLSTEKPWDILPGMFLAEAAGINHYKYKNLDIYSTIDDINKYLQD